MRLADTRDPKIMRAFIDIKEKYNRHQTHLGEAPGPNEDHSPAVARRDDQDMRTEREPAEREPTEKEAKGKDTRRLIVEVAERFFRQLGYQKTTVADIARELRMSPANVYRFFGAKSEINAAVCMELLGKIEAEAGKIAVSRGTALQRMRNLIVSVEKAHYKQYMLDRKLHELIEAAMIENWAIMREHNHRMTELLEHVIAGGMAAASSIRQMRRSRHALSTPLASAFVIRALWQNMSRSRNPLSTICSIFARPRSSGSTFEPAAALPLSRPAGVTDNVVRRRRSCAGAPRHSLRISSGRPPNCSRIAASPLVPRGCAGPLMPSLIVRVSRRHVRA